MSQSNEALAAEQPVEQEEQQQPEPQGLMETQPRNVSQETTEQPGDIPHLEPSEDAELMGQRNALNGCLKSFGTMMAQT